MRCSGSCHDALNRDNGRDPIFFKEGDYRAFLKALATDKLAGDLQQDQ
jgi:hypothetical protein